MPAWTRPCRHFRSPELPGDADEEVLLGGFSGSAGTPLEIRVKNLLQPIVNTTGFTGNAVGFSTGTLSTNNNVVGVYGPHADFNTSLWPELRGTYTPGAGQGNYARARRVALRFRDVRIPQGSVVSDVRLEFTPLSDSDDPISLNVSFLPARREGGTGPLQPNEFTTDNRALSSLRGADLGAPTVEWTVPRSEPWTGGSAVVTRDLSNALNPVIRDSDWCGGNDLVVLLEPTPATASRPGARDVASFNSVPASPGESFSAPRLHIELEAGTRQNYGPGEGCTVGTTFLRPDASADDARSNASNAGWQGFDHTSERIDADRQYIGMRFPNVPIPRDATVQKAELYVRALSDYSSSDAGAIKFEVYADNTGDSPSFSTADTGPQSRTASTAKVESNAMPPGAVDGGQEMLLADVQGPVQEIIKHANWQDGNALSLIGRRLHQDEDIEFLTYDSNPESAARLSIEYQYNVGDLTIQPPTGVTVREHLIQLVDDLTANGDTPAIDTYFEAARYFRGEAVHYGLTRAGHHDRELDGNVATRSGFDGNHARRSRISHRRSWTSATAPLPERLRDLRLQQLGLPGGADRTGQRAGVQLADRGRLPGQLHRAAD